MCSKLFVLFVLPAYLYNNEQQTDMRRPTLDEISHKIVGIKPPKTHKNSQKSPKIAQNPVKYAWKKLGAKTETKTETLVDCDW